MKWKVKPRVPGQPSADLRVLVSGIVVQDDVDHLAGRNCGLNGVEEAQELAVAMALHAAAEHGPLQHVERGKQRRRAMPDVVVRLGFGTAWLDAPVRARALQRLDLMGSSNREPKRKLFLR